MEIIQFGPQNLNKVLTDEFNENCFWHFTQS